MRLRRHFDMEESHGIDLAPMLDFVMNLLIFSIITAVFAKEVALLVNRPQGDVDQQVTDLFPSAITSVSWSAVASAGSSVAQASGTGNISTTVTLLPGGTVTFTAVAQISSSATTGTLTNTATVAVPTGDSTPANNSASDTDSLTPLAGLVIVRLRG